ncbi:MAG: hypothetical protein GF311_00955, partial [Candidatus Lokiarchaeota archaeon]|nr:hypothetical protein [Candidatus Lokiarchaeota archaeon]
MTLTLDEIITNYIQSFETDIEDMVNDLVIEFSYLTNDGYYEYQSDPVVLSLNYSEIQLDIEEGIYSIQYNKDLQKIYDMVGADNMDIRITISQRGNASRFIPYILLEQFDYLSDSHIIENFDRMPKDVNGNMDISSLTHTPHYFQLLSQNLLDEPFELLEDSQITIGLKNLPNTTLVSLENDQFTYLGDAHTHQLTPSNGYSIPNLGMFIDTYEIEEPLYQNGFVDLYYGSGTEIDGEKYYEIEIPMEARFSGIDNYESDIFNSVPTSWEDQFTFTTDFLTTDHITVSGEVLYHEIFDLTAGMDEYIPSAEIEAIFDEYEYIYFGIELAETDISRIKSIHKPKTYTLSVHGFPAGNHQDLYINEFSDGGVNPYVHNAPLAKEKYALEFDENGTAYVLFFIPMGGGEFGNHLDFNKLMVDYYVNAEFEYGNDYIIDENPMNPYESQIIWDYGFLNRTHYNLHPDFSRDHSFTVGYSALEWDIFDDRYIKDCDDIFTFRPHEFYNISVLYTGEITSENFSVQYIVPEGQYKEDHIIFPKIYVLAQSDADEDTYMLDEVPNWEKHAYIEQVAPNSYNYTINFDEIEANLLNGFHIAEDSYIYILARYNSTQLRYKMSRTPFNYEYVNSSYGDYHIKLLVDDQLVSVSSDITDFSNYVDTIKSGYIYFANRSMGEDGYIAPQSKIELQYKFKLQPGVLERKNVMIITKPWTNLFETEMNSSITYREQYRKLSGGSIIAPFEFSLSIEDKHSLYLSYRLTKRDYYEDVHVISQDAWNGYGYEYSIMNSQLDQYIDVAADPDDVGISVYYFNSMGEMEFLDSSHYNIDLDPYPSVIIKNDGNVLVENNAIDRFFIGFIPENENVEFAKYTFSYNPMYGINETLTMPTWELIGNEGKKTVIPNLDAFYYIDEEQSTIENTLCYTSEVSAYLEAGESIEFNLAEELNTDTYQELLASIHNGEYSSLYIKTAVSPIQSLDLLIITLKNSFGTPIDTQTVSREEFEMWDYEIQIDIPTTPNDLTYLEIEPIFRTDGIYDPNNQKGVPQMQYTTWTEDSAYYTKNGSKYMSVELEHDLIEEPESLEVAYIFNENAEHLTFPENASITWKYEYQRYFLQIPATYCDPENPAQLISFGEDDIILIRYNSPVRKALPISIGKMYFEKEGDISLPRAECMLINANGTTSQYYGEFEHDYYYSIPLRTTPFDTEDSGSYKAIEVNLTLSDLEAFADENGYIEFSNLMFSVPDPTYELTINEIVVLKNSYESTSEYGSTDSRVWQYSETEMFEIDEDPSDDEYSLAFEETPIFYEEPNNFWIECLTIYDPEGNYYSAGIYGDQYQLHYNSTNNTFTWNPSFNQYPDYFGMGFEEPLMVAPNETLYFEYCTNASWAEPIRIDQPNIDLNSIRAVYDYNYLLKPEHYDWYSEMFGYTNDYENIAYSFKEEDEYSITQFYTESFEIYEDISVYEHHFDLGDLCLSEDFVNLTLDRVIGRTPTFEVETLNNNENYTLTFCPEMNSLTIEDLEPLDGSLQIFDQISIYLNYSYAPVSTYSELTLLPAFNSTFLTDPEETFYNHLNIDYSYLSESGEVLFAESSDMIGGDHTSFESISYSPNPSLSTNHVLDHYGTELYDNFNTYYDESVIIYAADLESDGEVDYKEVRDLNRDGIYDIIKYGIDDPDYEGQIIWHTIIQHFEDQQTTLDRNLAEKTETQWFDIDDTAFAHCDKDIWQLLFRLENIFLFPILKNLGKLVIPDLDYWAKKTSQTETTTETTQSSLYYSVKTDVNRDGYADTQMDYEKIEYSTDYTQVESRETIFAAKYRDIYTMIGEYLARSVGSLVVGHIYDLVFTDKLTEAHLKSGDFGGCDYFTQVAGPVLHNTYRKFTEEVTTQYTSQSVGQESITITDYEKGEILEQRTYADDFRTQEIDEVEGYLSNLFSEHTITNVETGEQLIIEFDPTLPFTDPANISWSSEVWGADNIPIKYDKLTRDIDGEISIENRFSQEVTLA